MRTVQFIVIAAVLIAVVSLPGFTSFTQHSSPQLTTKQLMPLESNSAIKIAVIEFYARLDSCRKEKGSLSLCPLPKELIARGSSLLPSEDALVCSDTYPIQLAVNDVTLSQGTAWAHVLATFRDTTKTFQMLLRQENQSWKVACIICPH